jgi:glycosyltransferase involved in cell wall biosynthesis
VTDPRPFVTVIMPIRNEARFIARSLAAVLEQDYPVDRLEILVADGMSDDGTRDIVRALCARRPGLRLVDNPGQIVASGLNRAIREARGQVVVRVDGHTLIARDYVSECVGALQRSTADNVGGRMEARGDGRFGEAVALATSSPFGVGGARFHYSGREEWVDTVYMGAWRRNLFDRLGLFDEEMVRNQDDEFNYRILDHGGRILLTPRIRSVYTVRGRPLTLWRQYFQYGFWKVRVMRVHPRQIRLRQWVPPSFAAALLVTGVLGLMGGPAAAAFAVVAGAYAVANLAASVRVAGRSEWRHLWLLPPVYAILHLSYGLGFLAGILALAVGRGGGERKVMNDA